MSSTVVPAIIAVKMRQYKEAFRTAGATAPHTAIRPADAGLRQSLIFNKLVRQGVLVAVDNDRFYLDETRDSAVTHTRRMVLAGLVILILLILIISTVAAWKA